MNIDALTESINKYFPSVIDFFNDRELVVSPETFTVTLFTPDTKEFKVHPKIMIEDVLVSKTPWCHIWYNVYFLNTCKKIPPTQPISWNHSLAPTGARTRRLWQWPTRPLLEVLGYHYACPIWSPTISEIAGKKLQRSQNQALKIITCNHKMAQETKIPSIKEHCMNLSLWLDTLDLTAGHTFCTKRSWWTWLFA